MKRHSKAHKITTKIKDTSHLLESDIAPHKSFLPIVIDEEDNVSVSAVSDLSSDPRSTVYDSKWGLVRSFLNVDLEDLERQFCNSRTNQGNPFPYFNKLSLRGHSIIT